MFFCSECNNLYEISKNPLSKAQSETPKDVSESSDESEKSEESEESEEEKDSYKTENKTGGDVVEKKLYFVCKSCGNSEEIEKNTMIIKRKNKFSEEEEEVNTDIIYDSFYFCTRDYICINKNCASHKDYSKREAVFKRVNDSMKLIYVCKECKAYWKN